MIFSVWYFLLEQSDPGPVSSWPPTRIHGLQRKTLSFHISEFTAFLVRLGEKYLPWMVDLSLVRQPRTQRWPATLAFLFLAGLVGEFQHLHLSLIIPGLKIQFHQSSGVGIITFYKQYISTKAHLSWITKAPRSPAGHWLSSHGREKDTPGTFPVVLNLHNSCFQYAGDLGKQSKIIPWESRSHSYEKTRRRGEIVFNRVISSDPWWVLFYFILKMK